MSALCDEVERLGKGIGNVGRYNILESLMKGPRTVGEIVKSVKISQPRVSQHLKILKGANLVSDERRGQEVYYSINVAHMTSLLKKLSVGIEECPTQKIKK
jgi:DNA-binding transcriptional ArsR family regulator